jgi:hypothetical protein
MQNCHARLGWPVAWLLLTRDWIRSGPLDTHTCTQEEVAGRRQCSNGDKLAGVGLDRDGVLDLARGFHQIDERNTRNLTRARTRSYRWRRRRIAWRGGRRRWRNSGEDVRVLRGSATWSNGTIDFHSSRRSSRGAPRRRRGSSRTDWRRRRC